MHIPDRTAPGRAGVDEYSNRRLRGVVLAVVAMVAAALPLLLGLFVLTFALWFHDGGTFGGMGAAADDHYEPQTWSTVLTWAGWVVAVLIDLMVGWATYRRAVRGPSRPHGS